MGVGTFRVGTFVVVSDVCVWAEEERGVSVGPCGVHEGKRGSPMARGDAVARVAAWSERPAPPHHSLWAARRAQLSSLLERTVTNAHGLRDMSVHKPRRCQCALFYPSQILHRVFSHQIIAPERPSSSVSELSFLSRSFGAVKAYGASAATPKRAGCSDETVAVGSVHARERPASRRTDREHVERRGFRGEPRQRVSPETPQHGRARTDPRAPLTRDADVQARGNRIRDVLMDRSAARDPQDGTRTRRAARRPGVRRAGASGPRSQEDRRRVRGRPNHRQPPPGAGTPREARIRRRRVQTQPERIAERKRAGRGVGAMARAVRTRGQRGGHPRRAPGESRLPQRKKTRLDSASPATPQKHSWMRCSHLKQTH